VKRASAPKPTPAPAPVAAAPVVEAPKPVVPKVKTTVIQTIAGSKIDKVTFESKEEEAPAQ
jgi:hypothetical protein